MSSCLKVMHYLEASLDILKTPSHGLFLVESCRPPACSLKCSSISVLGLFVVSIDLNVGVRGGRIQALNVEKITVVTMAQVLRQPLRADALKHFAVVVLDNHALKKAGFMVSR
jgi:hypothetical protein